jgi:hypothetical protein
VAVLTARYAVQILENPRGAFYRWSHGFQIFTCVVLWALAGYLGGVAFPVKSWFILLGAFLALAAAVHFIFQTSDSFERLIYPSFFTIVGINFLLNGHIYPTLFTYQSGSQMARYAQYEAYADSRKLYALQVGGDSFYHQSADFYSATHLAGIFQDTKTVTEQAKKGTYWLYTNQEGLTALQNLSKQGDLKMKLLKTFPRYHISTLSIEFINPATRATQVQNTHLIQIN